MSMSTGDVRRPKKSGTPAASESPDADVRADVPTGGVLPVKKAARPGAAATGTSRSGATSRPSAAKSTGAAKSAGPATSTGAAKSTGAKPASKPADDELDDDLDDEYEDSAPAKPAARTVPAKSAAASRSATSTTSRTGAKATPGRTTPVRGAGSRPGTRGSAGYSASGGGNKKRKSMTPVRVSQQRNWGPIALYVFTGLLAIGIIGFGAWKVIERDNAPTWQEQAADIDGIHNYLETNPEYFQYDPNAGNHKAGPLTYPTSPPVGGVHNPRWQSCMGDVYTQQIANEQAVHALEHGAVWIAYRPDLPQDQINELASKVNGVEFTMMSPYPGLDVPISLQAWGYQLKLDKANDDRIDDFINALRKNATREPNVGCSGGITDATPAPLDLPGAS